MELIDFGVLLLVGISRCVVSESGFTRLDFRFTESRWHSSGNALVDPAPQCEKQTSACACETDQGLIDLSEIDSKDPTKPRFQATDSEGSVQYYYNPCTPFSFHECSGAAICRCSSVCQRIGLHAKDKFYVENDRLTIVYSDENTRSHVALICGQSKEPDGDFAHVNSSDTDFYFTLTSLHVCSVAPSVRRLSIGSILVICFVVLLIVYFVCGVVFMRIFREAEGCEMVPNLAFWKEFPFLVKDGVVFTYTSLFGCFRSSSRSSYQRI